jgi:excisionase family DNA binding protein
VYKNRVEVKDMRRLIKAEQVAAKLDTSRHRIYTLQREGLLPGVVRISGRQIRFDESAIDEWIAKGGNSEKVAAHAVAA